MFKLSLYFVRNKKISYKKFKDLSIKIFDDLCSKIVIKQNCTYYKVSYALPHIKLSKYDGIFEMWFENIESLDEVKNYIEFNNYIQNNTEIFNTNECNYIISEEYSAVFGNEMVYFPERIKFTTLLIKNNGMNFNEFKNHHKEYHVKLFASIPIIRKKSQQPPPKAVA